ncbi:ArsS family sensor histidine kinase [Arcobacter sp. F2176]|uniref:ArsS family sensor histidine kinase n=1 Tax=Arcobacter sp. F2176 TaxID=2044511 RepID=UPI00100ABDE4|nr:ArsS family sensor histidine kinase [Arcobacter sp. F2176]RXJ80347.1 two-component sensor histidine kinase [Arcobacter sp. F2176]
MKNISITAFINTIFVLALAAITTTFLFFVKLDKEKSNQERQQRYSIIANSVLNSFELLPKEDQLRKLYLQFEVKPIEDRTKRLDIINHARELMFQESSLGRVRIYEYYNKYYIYVQKMSYNVLLLDLKSKPYNRSIALVIYIFAVVIFLSLYFAIRKKFIPLRTLDKQIQKFSSGDKNIKLDFPNNDEIGKIAKSFNDAIRNINNLTDSKNLFMRNMMHELKTPITKAMFIVESLEDDKNKEVLGRAFERMNNIIKELATVEKLSSNMSVIYRENTTFFEIYKKAMNILLIDASTISTKMSNFHLKVDIALFSIIIKNLIDNAIKFSPNHHATLIATQKYIEVISSGEKLKYDLNYYTEPFSQEEKRKDGFGLGLYIVKTTIELHGFKFKYAYENGKNHFIIDMSK